MQQRTVLILVLFAAIIGLLGLALWKIETGPTSSVGNSEKHPSDDGNESVLGMRDWAYENASADVIGATSTVKISSAVVRVTGFARGWYFEGSFPVEIRDKNGALLGQAPAQAQSDWMTSEAVNFVADIPLSAPYSGEVLVILKKDNPSGLPENDASLSYKADI